MLKKLLLLLVASAVTLLAAEVVLRVAGIARVGQGSPWFAGGNHPRFLFQEDPASGYTLRPGFTGHEVSMAGEFDVAVAIDDRGLRAQPHPAAATPAVLALGDSMTFGEGVAADATYSALLERDLGVRVDNGGVPGYASTQMAERLGRLLPTVRPNLVLMTLCPRWDRQRCVRPFDYFEGYIVAHSYRQRLMLIDGNLYLKQLRGPLGPWTARLQARSALARLALPLVGEGLRSLVYGGANGLPPTPEAYAASADAIAAAQARARSAGAGFLAVLIDSLDDEFRREREALEPQLSARGVELLSLDELAPDAGWAKLHYPRDQHWNPDGHRRVATLLVPEIRARLGAAGRPLVGPQAALPR